MARETTIATPIPELDSAELDFSQLTKEDGTIITPSALQTLTLTLYNAADLEIINNVEATDILNTGRGTLDTDGHLVVKLQSADNPIMDDTLAEEVHKAMIIATWNNDEGRHTEVVRYTVLNLALVPAEAPVP